MLLKSNISELQSLCGKTVTLPGGWGNIKRKAKVLSISITSTDVLIEVELDGRKTKTSIRNVTLLNDVKGKPTVNQDKRRIICTSCKKGFTVKNDKRIEKICKKCKDELASSIQSVT